MKTEKLKYLLELVVFFILLPVVYYFDWIASFWKFIPILFFFGYCIRILIINNQLSAKDFKLDKVSDTYWLKLLVFPILFISFLIFTGPEVLLADFSNNRILFAIICYPLFSSLPQEIIYRKFFFLRYKKLFNNRLVFIIVNGALFSIAHLYFKNSTALLFTFVGGLIFASSYLKTKSLLYVTIEHAIYGLLLLSSYMNDLFYRAF